MMNSSASHTTSRKLPARYASLVLPLLLSILMTLVVSFISTVNGRGFDAGFLGIWLRAWGVSWLIAFPTLLLVLPLVRRVTAAVVHMG
ncbi:DUF2798 domain-containing protein [Nocardia otitidiscaviarum]|nr:MULTISPECIES: DUF2798 domain-containing protein [Nocardia]MBF6135457.1 DUF2798 domain-containing protein [Nocardia otitidiscaviarum]MBF6237432.1 DUF2798 domain-containing protein [Nocardia otitidiscaviarum]MBF6487274.1 DUF2798 domain-containing protein [Nocardia otitidiscaviarum]